MIQISFYSILLIAIVFIPLLLSFNKRIEFRRIWKYLFFTILFIVLISIPFKIYFLHNSVLGFNPNYTSKLNIRSLPLEEILYYLVIPYFIILLFCAFKVYFPELKLKGKISAYFTFFLLFSCLLVTLENTHQEYTFYTCLKAFVALFWLHLDETDLKSKIYILLPIIVIPLFFINAILNGTAIQYEIVWHNNNEIWGKEILNVPLENILYIFSIVLFTLLFFNTIAYPKKTEWL